MAQKTSKSNEAYFARYKQGNLYVAHRKAKLEKLIKLQPNNKQLPIALKGLANYRRKAPNTPQWSHTMISVAKLFKLFTGRFSKDVFSQKLEDAEAARKLRSSTEESVKVVKPRSKYSDYALAQRAHDGAGNLVWS